MPRLPRPRLPSGGRIRERIRSRRRDRAAGGEANDGQLELSVEASASPDPAERPEPKPKRRRSAAFGSRVGGAARRVRYFLGDAVYVAGRGLEAIGRGLVAVGNRARGLWFRFSLTTRRRIAAAAAVLAVAALVWFAAVPNLPCQFPAGEECPPEDDAAEIVPGDALAYAHANVDQETDQFAEAATLANRLPTLTDQILGFLPGPSGVPLDFQEDVRPWLGGEVALSLLAGPGGRPEQTLLFEVSDTAGAQAFAERLASGPPTETDHSGVAVRTDQRGNSSAIVSGFLVLGPEAAVEQTIDVAQGNERPLTTSPLAEQVLDSLPEDAVAQVAVSEAGVAELVASGRGALGSLEAFVDSDASVGAGAALVVDEDVLEVAVHSELDPERLEASPGFFEAFAPFDPSLASELGPETLAYLGLGDPAASIEDLFTQAIAEAPGVATGFDELIDELRRTGKLDVQSELLPLLQGQASISIQPSPPGESGAAGTEAEAEVPGEDIGEETPGETPAEELLPPEGAPAPPGVVADSGVPYLLFVAEDVDEDAAREALAKLQGPLAEALDPAEQLQAPVFEEREIAGVEAQSLRLSRTVDLTYAIFEDRVVIATDPRGIAQVAEAGDDSLADSAAFEAATEGMPEEPALLAYFNVADLLALAEREGLSEDPGYAFFAADARRLEAMALSVEQGETTLDTTIRVPVE
jgi:hypothetical protein